MSTKTPLASNPRLPLLLAKLHKHDYVGSHRRADFKVDVDGILLELATLGLLDLGDTFAGYTSVTLTTLGQSKMRTPVADALTPGVKVTPENRAFAALWSWLLIHGWEDGGYDSQEHYGKGCTVLHLIVCGLSKSKSSAVRDDVWTTWGGTFADGDRVTGVSGTATCLCGKVDDVPLRAEVESITGLIIQLAGL